MKRLLNLQKIKNSLHFQNILLTFSYKKFYMYITRPATANREVRSNKNEHRNSNSSTIKRPTTTENASLRKIIQIIENTLKIGPNVAPSKTKNNHKSGNKQNLLTEYSNNMKLAMREKQKIDKLLKVPFENVVPHKEIVKYVEPKESGSIYHTQKDQFLPYRKQLTYKTECFIGKEPAKYQLGKQMKKISKLRYPKPQNKSLDLTDQINQWNNQSTVENFSKLFGSGLS